MVWNLCGLLALAALIWSIRTPAFRLWGVALAALFGLLTILLLPERFYIEKSITIAVMPVGVLWLGLLVLVLWSLSSRQRAAAGIAGVLWILLTIAGHREVASALVRHLESPYAMVDPLDQGEFEAVCVLGGGATFTPAKRVMLNFWGDRIALGAELFHSGATTRLVTTGKTPLNPTLPSPAERTVEFWTHLGIPQDAIETLPGENTHEEIREIKALVRRKGWSRVGIVTSAWHLARAERLAEAAGLEFVPLPADFLSPPVEPSIPWLDRVKTFTFIPDADSLTLTTRVLKEHLAGLAGR